MRLGFDCIGVSAGAVIFNENGKVFLALRGESARDDRGKWEFPGGKVKLGETRAAAAKRNIAEKYGLEIEIAETLGVYDVIDDTEGDHWLSTTFVCRRTVGEGRIEEP